METPIRIMLCDDSAVMRRLVKTALESDSNLKVVEEAHHGQDALNKLPSAKPDLVIMDVEMPVMDGIDTVRSIRRQAMTVPIIMFSSLTSRGAEATLDAIAAGASDFATKPSGAGHFQQALEHVRRDLIPKVFQWGGKHVAPSAKPRAQGVAEVTLNVAKHAAPATSSPSDKPISVIAIGVSTGGPQTLASLVSELPVNFPVPILIAQHMPPVFTGLLADRLASQKGHAVREAVDGEELKAGEILIAPGDHHLFVQRDKDKVRAHLNQEAAENSCRPSVDPLFRSVANTYGNRSLGIVLTGMGTDGANGSQAMKQTGAKVFVQDEQTSVIWGMPGNVVRCGFADRILPLNQIASEMIRITTAAPVAAI